MAELTKSLESSTRKKIDAILNSLGWKTDEEKSDCNVFTERAKTKEQDKKFNGKDPDYVLYKSNTDEPLAIIEAKRKGESIEDALNNSIKKYAIPLKVNILFVYDSTFIKSWDLRTNRELTIDNEILRELISEERLLRFIKEGSNIDEVTPETKHTREELIKIFKWANDLLRKEGLRNLDRFVEFSNILFIKIISEIENDREKRGLLRRLDKSLCWESFADNSNAKTMLNYINDTVLKKGLAKEYNHTDDIFQEKLKIQNPNTVMEIVKKLTPLKLLNTESEIKGDAFEYFLKSLASGNDLGEYFTPRHIVKLMVWLLNPKFGNSVFDPFCGTGGFLIESFRHIKKGVNENDEKLMNIIREKTFFGVELTDTYKIAKMNMILIGDGHNHIVQSDTAKIEYWDKFIQDENDKDVLKLISNLKIKGFDIVFSNIPYGQTTDYGKLYPIDTTKGDSIFLQSIFKSLVRGGVASVIIPHGEIVSNTTTKSLINTRKFLLENCDIFAIISLPRHAFEPYTSVKTDIIFFKKGESTKKTWFYRVDNDGYELNANRRKISGKNDLDNLREIWLEKPIGDKSFYVTIDTIKKNGYRLDIECYEEKIKKEFNYGTKKLSDVAEVISGFAFKSEEYSDNGLPIIRIQNVIDGEIKGEFVSYNVNKLKYYEDYTTKKEDIILVLTRPVIKSNIKKVAFVQTDKKFLLNQRLAIIRVKDKEKVLPDYLYSFFFSDYYKSKIKDMTKGQLQPNVSIKDLMNLEIPIPNPDMQKVIVHKMKVYYDNIRNINNIFDNYNGIYIESSIFNKIERKPLLEFCDFITNSVKEFSGKKLYLTTGNLIGNDVLGLEDIEYKNKPSRANILVKEDDIIFAKMEKSVKNLKITKELDGIIVSTGFVNLRIKDKNVLLPDYLFYYISTNEFQRIRDSLAKGSTQTAIGVRDLEKVNIPIPKTKEEQIAIINICNEKMDLIKNLEKLKERESNAINFILSSL